MSVLSKLREYFGFAAESESTSYTPPPTLDEKLAEAAADRGYAFDLLESVEEALADAAELEAEVAAESLRQAEQVLVAARESAARILENGHRSAVANEERAALAQKNANDDEAAVRAIRQLVAAESHDVGASSSEGWDA